VSGVATPVALLQRLLRAADAKAAHLAAHVHPAWIEAAWRHVGAPAARHAQRVAPSRRATLLAEVYGLQWPTLADLRHPAHRLALLARPQILRVLAACALHGQRDSVRRSIARDVRSRVIQHIGEPAYQQLLASPAQGAAAITPLSALELDLDRLAAAGYHALCTQGAWQCRSALALTRMSLAPAALEAGQGRTPPAAAPAGMDAHTVLTRLPDYFPEHTWLFGSDMDRALSA
jgi:hypothetical protein